MPNPTLITGTENNGAISSGTSATVTSTGNVTAGNLMIVAVLVGGSTLPTGISAPGGWSTLLTTTTTESSGLVAAAIFYKQNTSTASFSGSFSWTQTATSGHWAFMEWSGAGASFIDGSVASSLNASGTKTSPTITPGTGNVNDTLVCCIFGGVVGADSLTAPGGMAAITSMATAGTSSVPFFYGASLNLASASATGTKTWTIPTSRACLGVSFLIEEGPVWGWDTVAGAGSHQQPPHPLGLKKFGSIAKGDEGTEGVFNYWNNAGWEPSGAQVSGLHAGAADIPARRGAARLRSEFAFQSPFVPMGWEVQPPQPPCPIINRRGGILKGDDGTEAKFVPPVIPTPTWGFEPFWQPLARAKSAARASATKGKTGFAFPAYNFDPRFGWENQAWQPPARAKSVARASATKGKTGFAFPAYNFDPRFGWENQAWQPPARAKSAPRASATKGKTGFAFPAYNFDPRFGWENQAWQPPHPRPEKTAALFGGDPGNEAPFIPPAVTIYVGYEQIDAQLRHPRPERSGSIARGDDGIVGPLIYPFVEGWAVQPPQPPHPKPERAGAIARGDEGDEGVFNFWHNSGWEIHPPQPPFPRQLKRSAILRGEDGTEYPFLSWHNDGWEVQSWQAPHPRPERSGAIAAGDTGIEAKFIPPTPTSIYWALDQLAPLRKTSSRAAAIKFRSEFTYSASFVPMGWEVQPPQPPHPKPERGGAIAHGDDGNEGLYTYIPPLIYGFDQIFAQPLHPRPERAGSLMRGDDGTQAPFVRWLNDGWAVQPWQPPHPRPERSGAIAAGDTGIEAKFIPPTPTSIYWALDQLAPLRKTSSRAAAIKFRSEFTYPASFVPMGWEILPPHIRQPQQARAAAAFGKSQFAIPGQWFNAGWEIQPWQPPHPRREKIAAILRGDDGIEGVAVHLPALLNKGFEQIYTQPPHPRPERAGSLMRGDDGTQAPFVRWLNDGWAVQPWQPPAYPTVRQRYPGTKGKSEFAINQPWFYMGWEVQPVQPPHPRPERSAAIARSDDGAYSKYVFFVPFNYGFDPQPVQPPRRPWQNFAAIVKGDDGIEGVAVHLPALLNKGFEQIYTQPPHPRPERAGSLMRGDDGTQAPFVRWLNDGWAVQPWQPPHPRPERGGALIRPEDLQIKFVVPPPAPGLPGGGKRYHPGTTEYEVPIDLPAPPYGKKARKPIKPIWDRRPVEEPEKPKGPPPLPPMSIFGPGGTALDVDALPNFRQYMMPRAGTLAERLRQAQVRTAYDDDEQAIVLILDSLDNGDEE